MTSNVKECITIHSFELHPTELPIDKFQLAEDHDQAQNTILEVHVVFYSFIDFSKNLENLYTKYKTFQCQHIQQTNKN